LGFSKVGAYGSRGPVPSFVPLANREGEREGERREGRGWEGKGGEGREERGMGACTHWDFRKSAPMSAA